MLARTGGLIAAVAAVLALVGCATEGQSDMTAETARDELAALFDETETLLGGDWENRDDPAPYECTTAGGGVGVQYAFSRLGDGATDEATIDAHLDEVAALWGEHGYETEVVREGDLGPRLVGGNDRRSRITFAMSTEGSFLSGGSDCEPGSPEASEPVSE